MEKISELAKGIDIKSRQLALRFTRLKEEMAKLEQKNQELEKTTIQHKQNILELEKQIQILTITKSIPTGKESSIAKKKINELLRELDTCIDLLNNKTI